MGVVFYRYRQWGAVASKLLVIVSCAVMLDERVRVRIRAEVTEEAYNRDVSWGQLHRSWLVLYRYPRMKKHNVALHSIP